MSGFRGPPTDSHGTEEDVTHGLDAQAEHIELLLQLSIGLLVVAQRWRDHPALRLLLAHGADTSLVNPSNSLSNLPVRSPQRFTSLPLSAYPPALLE